MRDPPSGPETNPHPYWIKAPSTKSNAGQRTAGCYPVSDDDQDDKSSVVW